MSEFQIVFSAALVLTILSGMAATSIVLFGDTRRNAGQRNVAEKFAQIALLGSPRLSPCWHRPDEPAVFATRKVSTCDAQADTVRLLSPAHEKM